MEKYLRTPSREASQSYSFLDHGLSQAASVWEPRRGCLACGQVRLLVKLKYMARRNASWVLKLMACLGEHFVPHLSSTSFTA